MNYRGRWNKHGCFKVGAYDGRVRVGEIDGCEAYKGGERVAQVRFVKVKVSHRRRRIGTRLYEHAADLACERGMPLASAPSWQRNRLSSGFWDKQRDKGRVIDMGDGVFVLRQTCGANLGRRPRRR